MTALPAATDFTGASITEAQFKTALTNMRAFLSELLGASGTDRVAALTALGAILCDSLDKTGAYTVVAADKGKVINCNGTFTLSLDAAATLGDAFSFSVWNNGSGTITIDPNASELIDGATTKALAAGKLAIVYCDGAKFVTVGSIATGPGSGLDADTLDGNHASAFAAASHTHAYVDDDVGYNAIGSFCFIYVSGTLNAGATTSVPQAVSFNNSGGINIGNSLSGTWRNVSATVPAGGVALAQRIS